MTAPPLSGIVTLQQFVSGCLNAYDAKLALQLFPPLRHEQFRTDDENLGDSVASHQLADDQPRANRLTKSHVIRKQCNGQPATECHQIVDLVMIGLYVLAPFRL